MKTSNTNKLAGIKALISGGYSDIGITIAEALPAAHVKSTFPAIFAAPAFVCKIAATLHLELLPYLRVATLVSGNATSVFFQFIILGFHPRNEKGYDVLMLKTEIIAVSQLPGVFNHYLTNCTTS